MLRIGKKSLKKKTKKENREEKEVEDVEKCVEALSCSAPALVKIISELSRDVKRLSDKLGDLSEQEQEELRKAVLRLTEAAEAKMALDTLTERLEEKAKKRAEEDKKKKRAEFRKKYLWTRDWSDEKVDRMMNKTPEEIKKEWDREHKGDW